MFTHDHLQSWEHHCTYSWTLSTDQLVNPLPHPPSINSVTVVPLRDSTTGCFPLAVHSLLRVWFPPPVPYNSCWNKPPEVLGTPPTSSGHTPRCTNFLPEGPIDTSLNSILAKVVSLKSHRSGRRQHCVHCRQHLCMR